MDTNKQMLITTPMRRLGRVRDLDRLASACPMGAARHAVMINSAAVKAVAASRRPAATSLVMGGVSFEGTGLGIAVEPIFGGGNHPTHDSTKYDTRTGTDWSPPV